MIAVRRAAPSRTALSTDAVAALGTPPDAPLDAHLLQAELGLLRQFHTLLSAETAALESGAATAVSALAGQRAGLCTELQTAARTRLQALDRAGAGSDAASIGRYIASARCDDAVRKAWRTLQRAYRQLAAHNRNNTRFIARQLDYLESRWNGLMQCAGQDRVYLRNGAGAAQTRPHRLIVSA